MAFHYKQNADGTAELVADGNSINTELKITFTSGAYALIGRGSTDTDITYLGLTNADGELCYIYANAAQNAIVVSGTKP